MSEVGERPCAAGPARLAELIQSAHRVVALTGAGISVPSGVPDFRSPQTGLWANVNPMEVAHIDAFRRDPVRFWEFYRPRFHMLGDKRPNPAHLALAELEERGFLETVITQNIDRLHQAAGSRRLLEIHGSIATSSCMACGARYRLAEVEQMFGEDHSQVPECRQCQTPIRPDVVLFGEMLPEREMGEAIELAASADLMLAIGTSLEVHPAAGLVDITLRNGGEVVIVTQGPTPYDEEAELKLTGDVAEELSAVMAMIGGSR
jgi:NAD-dependent deacetylase